MSKNSQILEKVGGLEAAQAIVNGAPDETATHFNMDTREGLYTRAGANGFAEWFYVTGKEWVKGFVKNSAMDWRDIKLSDLRTAITEQRIAEPYNNHEKFQNLAESLREIGGQYQDENHLGRQAYETSAAYIERELQELCGTPVAPTQTHAELVLHEQIKNLNSSRNFWRLMFFAVFLGYGVVGWIV